MCFVSDHLESAMSRTAHRQSRRLQPLLFDEFQSAVRWAVDDGPLRHPSRTRASRSIRGEHIARSNHRHEILRRLDVRLAPIAAAFWFLLLNGDRESCHAMLAAWR